jgi:uncharacterized protein (TIGR03435 family)
MRRTILTACIFALGCSATFAQTFEVATIKPCEPPTSSGGRRGATPAAATPGPSPGRLSTSCQTVAALINIAYVRFANGVRNGPQFVPLSGGPAWINSQRYGIKAKAADAASQETMQGPMLQALLEDRFKLKIHRATKEVPVFELTVAKGGPKLAPSKEGSCTTAGAAQPGPPPQSLEPRGISLDAFATNVLPTLLDRPVINKTGIAGLFDIHLEFAADESTPGLRLAPSDQPPAAPSIFTAIQEQTGLKLESAKGPGEFLIIDSVDRPTEN